MAIQQHPIPQNVTSYQFRLIGDMTLKQFLQLAAGIVIGLIIYATALPGFLKWPLIGFFVGLGALIAFVPLQGRSVDQWLLALIRAIYKPTLYTWQKKSPPPQKNKQETTPPSPTQDFTTATPQPRPSFVPKNTIPGSASQPLSSQASTTSIPAPTTSSKPSQPESKPQEEKSKSGLIPPGQPIRIKPQPKPQIQEQKPQTQPETTTTTPATATPTKSTPTQETTFGSNLPIPHAPTTPNTIVGMTLTPQGNILDGAIVEITQDSATIRATKSNKLGQFLFAKPLEDGTYHITGEKSGFTFPTFSLELKGEVIPPIRLQTTK